MQPCPSSEESSIAIVGLAFDLLAIGIGIESLLLHLVVPLPLDLRWFFSLAIPLFFSLIGGFFGLVGMALTEVFRWPFWIGTAAMLLAAPGVVLASLMMEPLGLME